MKARREPLVRLDVVDADEEVDVRAFLRRYIGAILAEVEREGVHDDPQEQSDRGDLRVV